MKSQSHKDKIVVVGTGNVGEAIAYTLMVRAQANDIVLIDLNEDRAQGAALDIVHGTSFRHHVNVRKGGYEECADAGIIILTAGIARKLGQTRLELAKTNVSIIRSITRSVMKYAENPLFIVVSNPADITTAAVVEESHLDPKRVIGSGTSLDTARFRYWLSDALQVSVEDIDAYVLGEHGDSQVPVFSSATVAGIPLEEYARQTDVVLERESIAERTRFGGAEVIKLKGATFYGVAMAVSTIVETICHNSGGILPVAHVLDESFGEWSGVTMSLPCRVGGEGIEQTLRISMNAEETEAMNRSAEILKEFEQQVKKQDHE